MRRRVQECIDNCIICLTVNSSPSRFEGETFLMPLKASMDVVHVDHFSPLRQTERNYKHILVIIDAFTRFTWLFSTKSMGTVEAVKCLRSVFHTFDNSTEIVTNRGTTFTSSEFTHSLRAKHRKVAVAIPWANGIVERVNKFPKRFYVKVRRLGGRME